MQSGYRFIVPLPALFLCFSTCLVSPIEQIFCHVQFGRRVVRVQSIALDTLSVYDEIAAGRGLSPV